MHKLFSSPRVCIAGSSQVFAPGARIRLALEQRHRLETVMRCRKGDLVRLFDGCSEADWFGLLQDGHVVLDSQIARSKQNGSKLTMLAFGRLANKDVVRQVISAGVQLGVDILLPLMSERCQRSSGSRSASKEAKAEEGLLGHYLSACAEHPLALSLRRSAAADGSWPLAPAKAAAAVVEACEQSERWSLPLLLPAVPLAVFADAWTGAANHSGVTGSPAAKSTPGSSSSKRLHNPTSDIDASTSKVGLFPRLRGLTSLSCSVRFAAVAHEGAADARHPPAGPQAQTLTAHSAALPQSLYDSVRSWRRTASIQNEDRALSGIPTARAQQEPHRRAEAGSLPLPLLAVMVGPEGGWGPADEPALASLVSPANADGNHDASGPRLLPPTHDRASRSGAFVSLGQNVLRAETAALAALAVVNAALE